MSAFCFSGQWHFKQCSCNTFWTDSGRVGAAAATHSKMPKTMVPTMSCLIERFKMTGDLTACPGLSSRGYFDSVRLQSPDGITDPEA